MRTQRLNSNNNWAWWKHLKNARQRGGDVWKRSGFKINRVGTIGSWCNYSSHFPHSLVPSFWLLTLRRLLTPPRVSHRIILSPVSHAMHIGSFNRIISSWKLFLATLPPPVKKSIVIVVSTHVKEFQWKILFRLFIRVEQHTSILRVFTLYSCSYNS